MSDCNRAIILAGGLGTRLRPYTACFPKPLMPINGEIPILEIVLRQLKVNGFSHVTLAVGYLGNIIEAFFGDGSKWGLKIEYSREEKALSTIGPITLIESLPDDFLVMNGDILTDMSFRSFMDFHVNNKSEVSVAISKREVAIDYGVIEYKGRKITGFKEKPNYHFDISMGIYALNRNVIASLEKNKPYGFDNLMIDGIKNGMNMMVFEYDGYWLDIGRPDDYERANNEFANMRGLLLGDD